MEIIGLLVKTKVKDVTGTERINSFSTIRFHVQDITSTGVVNGDIITYASEKDYIEKKESFFLSNDNSPVAIVTFKVLPDDVIKQSGVCIMQDVIVYYYNKAAQYLIDTYNWDVEVVSK